MVLNSVERDVSRALDLTEKLQDYIAEYFHKLAEGPGDTVVEKILTDLSKVQNLLDRSYSAGFDDYDLSDQLELDFGEEDREFIRRHIDE